MINFKDLETKGFLVLKNFLSKDAINLFKQDYNKQLIDNINLENKNYKIVGTKDLDINKWITPIINTIAQNTNLVINTIIPNHTYFNNQFINFPWHQDHECYYRWQDMYNSINCWIPVIKPNSNQSGLSIIPHDVFNKEFPDIFKNCILGKGAKTFYIMEDGTTNMNDDNLGGVTKLPYDISKMAITPDLSEGDILIMRQDIIHRTQDNLDNRVAISIKCRDINGIISKTELLKSCNTKRRMINNNVNWYNSIMEKFESVDQLTIKDTI